MIMQGKTPRSLSWAGLLTIVGLGLFLLPVRAQAPRSDTEREIEKLKQALKALEEKHRAEKEDAAESKKASAEEIAEAKEEAAKLGKVAESKRREFEAAVQQHHRAMARLAKLQGKPLHSYGLWIEDGKLHTSGEGSPRRRCRAGSISSGPICPISRSPAATRGSTCFRSACCSYSWCWPRSMAAGACRLP